MDYEMLVKQLTEQKDFLEKKFKDSSDTIETLRTEYATKIAALEKQYAESADMLKKFAGGVSLPGVDETKQKFSLAKAVAAIVNKDWAGAEFEQEVFKETRKKATTTGSGASAGFLVPNQYVAQLIEMYRQEAIITKLGATWLTDLTGSPIEMPKQTGGCTAQWTGENAKITSSDPTTGQISMSPHGLTALVKMSRRSVAMTNPSIEEMVRADVASAMSLKIDAAALRGAGTDSEPLGIANTSGIKTLALGTNGGFWDYSAAMDMEYELELAHSLKGKLAYVMHPAIKRRLKKYRIPNFPDDQDGNYVMLPMSDAKMKENMGYGFATTTELPITLSKGSATNCSEVYFGNWSELLIGQWGGLTISVSSEAGDAFEYDQVWIKFIQDLDIAVRHPESFCLCSDACIA